jgi:hypothetical protein
MMLRASSWVRRLFRGHRRPTSPARKCPLGLEILEAREVPAAGWTALANTAPSSIGTMELLTDGTVLAQGAGTNAAWYKLTPDVNGSYVNGTWSTMASMSDGRLYTATNILLDGRMLVVGGEYTTSGGNNWTNTGEIYNPVTNTWAGIPNFPQSQFGDDPGMLMDDGRVLLGYLSGPQTYLYNPATNTYSAGPTKLYSEQSDEETWVKLPDGSVLTYNIFSNPQTAQKLDPTTNTWVAAGNVPVQLETSSGKELGGAVMLMDGRVLFLGATNHTAIYTPSSNSWVAGPDIPGGLGCNDAPCAVLPDGHVIFDAGSTPGFANGSSLFDYNPTTNTITQITTPAALTNQLAGAPAFTTRFLMLPNGQALFTTGNGTTLFAYNAAGTAQAVWKPAVSNITNSGSVYTLTGTQITGMSAGASYGDDAEMDTNYPIVELTDGSGKVYFAKTTNWSTTRVQTGSTAETVNFTLPSGLPNGTYSLTVSASGITSAAFSFTVGATTSPTYTVGEFSGAGVWRYKDTTGWQQLSGADASLLKVDSAGDVVAVFSNGTWLYENSGGWKQLSGAIPYSVDVATGNGNWASGPLVVGSFGNGVWRYADSKGWSQMGSTAANQVAIDIFGDVVGDYYYAGVWLWYQTNSTTGSWTQLSGAYAYSVDVDGSGANAYVVGSFSNGVWKNTFNGTSGSWTQLGTTAANQVAIDSAGDVVADYYYAGVWKYTASGTSWTQLSGAYAASVDIASDGTIVGGFSNGVWRYGTSWRQLTSAYGSIVGVG